MKIIINDFAGHPFQFQLSRELARRGHEVLHTFFADISGPKGNTTVSPEEASRLSIEPIRIKAHFERYSYLQRLIAHYQYVNALTTRLVQFKPDVVISGNMPTDAQYRLSVECRRRQIGFVHWVQDYYALALKTFLSRHASVWGKLGAMPFQLLDRRIFKRSASVIYICDEFAALATGMGYAPKRSTVIENWATLDDLPMRSKRNAWSERHSLADKFVFLYSGTMGLKHDPYSLVSLARHFRDCPNVRVVLVSEGIGRRALEQCKLRDSLDNLELFDFQPYSDLPDVLASADVLLANVEQESSVFSVPSKILSYMCAGRPILVSLPRKNLAARVIERAQAGYTCEPSNPLQLRDAAQRIWADQPLRESMGANARRYAEATFDIRRIGDLFEAVLTDEETVIPELAKPIHVRV